MPYSSYDHDKLEAAETMRIERRIYFEAKDREIAPYASLPIAQLLSMRSESAAAEQAIFDDLKERAAAWEEQAGRTLLLDKTLEYVRTPHVQHTANEWQTTEHNRHIRSNRVYQMNYYIYENTRYDKEAQKSIPYSWTLTWSVRTNSPSRTQAKIAGQDRKVFTDKAAMEKYLNGRIKAYDRLFTEISPPIPQEYADYFKVNGMLMPDYTIEGEEPPQQQQAAAIPENTGQEKEREHMSEQFSIMIGNRSRFDAGDPGGYWLDMPATKEQLHEAMRNVGITADNPQDFSIRGYSDDPEKHIALPYEMVGRAERLCAGKPFLSGSAKGNVFALFDFIPHFLQAAQQFVKIFHLGNESIYRRFQLCFVACPLLFGGVFCIAFSLVLSRYDDG